MATSAEKAIGALVGAWSPGFSDPAWWGSDPTVPGGRVLSYVKAAIRGHTAAAFLGVYNDAMACWALHWLTFASRDESTAFGGNVAGPVTSIRTGDESIGFQQSGMSGGSPSDAQFMETSWGKRYLSYRDSRPDAHLFVI